MLSRTDKVKLLLKGLNISSQQKLFDDTFDIELKSIYQELYGDEALKKAINFIGYPKPFHSDWNRLIEAFFIESKFSNYEIKEIAKRVIEPIQRNFLWIFLINKAVQESDIEFAEEIINELPLTGYLQGPLQNQGHRVLLKYYASQADFDNYKLRLKKCEIKRQSHINLEKSILISAYSEKNGWEKGLELVKTKEFGTFFYLHFMLPQAKLLTLSELEHIFIKHPELFEGNPSLRELTYVKFFEHEAKTFLNLETFDTVFDLLIKTKNGTNHDWQFFELAQASKNIELIKKCKKVIKTAHIHRELNICIESLGKK